MAERKPIAVAFWEKVEKTTDLFSCWIWKGARNRKNYGLIGIHKEDAARLGIAQRLIAANRMSWLLTRGPIPKGYLVCHVCDNPPCVRPSHLWLGTNGENIKDSFDKGRSSHKGENHPRAKLTWEKVREIRTLAATGRHTKAEIGRMYGVSDVLISYITLGRNWNEG